MENKYEGNIDDALYLLSEIESKTSGFVFAITFFDGTWRGRIIFKDGHKIEYANINILIIVNNIISCIMRNRSESVGNRYMINRDVIIHDK